MWTPLRFGTALPERASLSSGKLVVAENLAVSRWLAPSGLTRRPLSSGYAQYHGARNWAATRMGTTIPTVIPLYAASWPLRQY